MARPRRAPGQRRSPIGATRKGSPPIVARYLEWLRVHNYAEPTVQNRELYLGYFIAWCAERGLTAAAGDHQADPGALPALALSPAARPTAQPLTFRSQYARLVPVRAFFRWLARQNYLLYNPASELELPRSEHRLPKHVLTIAEVEQVMAAAATSTNRMGLRDRAMLETLLLHRACGAWS